MRHHLAAIVSVAATLWTGAALAGSPDAREVMEAVKERDTGDRMTAALEILITDGARERVRSVRMKGMDAETGRMQLILFEAPADVRNTGVLSLEHEGDRPDDQWLYLPSLARSTRLAATDKSGSFMGTDLTYADLTVRDPDDYDYTFVTESAEVDGEDCWVVEATPRTESERAETGYLRSHLWVSKDKLMPLQVKSWVIDGRKVKYTRMLDVRRVDGIWFAHRLVVRTLDERSILSTSVLSFSNVAFGSDGITAEEFTVRRLELGL